MSIKEIDKFMKKNKTNLTTYCISHKYDKKLDKLNLKLIGSGGYKKKFPSHWLNDAKGKKNISKKNYNYGSLTSIYWIWKNDIKLIKSNNYIAISHYRRFWLKENYNRFINSKNLKKNLLTNIPVRYNKYDAFVCSPINLKGYKLSKLFKKAKRSLIKDPSIMYNKKKHTINLHFNMFHTYNGLINSCKLLNMNDRDDFLKYVNTKTEYFPLSIFIIKKKFFTKLCGDTFKWLKKCEKLFNKKELKNYGEIRIFDFLAERYFSFWISKYCKHKTWPYKHLDVNK